MVWSTYLIVYLSRLCVGPLSPFLKESFNLTNAQVGVLSSATVLGYAPTLLIAGWFVDRMGVKRALAVGTIFSGISVGSVALAPSYWVMFTLLAISGLGCGFIYPAAVKAIMVWFPPHERGTAVGVNQSAVNISGMMGAAIMPALATSAGWRAGFLAASALAFCVCLFAMLVYRRPTREEARASATARCRPFRDTCVVEETVEEEDIIASTELSSIAIDQGLPSVTGDERADRDAVSVGFHTVIRSRDVILVGLAGLFICMVEFAPMAHMVLFLKVDWAYTVVAAGGMLALCQGAGAFSKPLSGLVSDRLLKRRRKPALAALSLLSAGACAGLALIDPGQTTLLWVLMIVLGVGAIGWGGLYGTISGEIVHPARSGSAAAVTAAIDSIGIFAGPPLFGYIVDVTGSYKPAWWTMAAAAVIAAVLFASVHERQG